MAAVAASQAPIPIYKGDNTALLNPPRARQPYTPPPQSRDDSSSSSRPLSRTEDEVNGDMEVDMKSLRANNVEASAGQRRKTKSRSNSGSGPQSLAGMLRRGIVDHQLGLSLNVVLLVGMSWFLFPSLREKLEAGFTLSYKVERTGLEVQSLYGQGPRDLWLVASLVIVFTGVRAFMLDYVLMPLAGLMGIRKKKGKVRFAEQSYLLLYYTIYWTWGVRLFIQETPATLLKSSSGAESWISSILISLWTNFPKLYVEAAMKFYYLSQLAFWAQQIVVIHLEERRHDHYQMLTHHFVTVALMSTSYAYRQWRVGNAVLACMDIVDLVFPLAKILRYLSLQAACDACFALFVVTWIAARHVAYLSICWSIYAHVNQVTMPYGIYSIRSSGLDSPGVGLRLSSEGGNNVWSNVFQPFINTNAETVSFNGRIKWGFLGLLLGLQCITLMWLIMIIKVVIRVLRGEGADDSRSDAEDEDEEEELNDVDVKGPVQPSAPFTIPEQPRFIEVEADSTELSHSYIRRSGSGSNAGSKSRLKSKGAGGFSSGLNLGERKQILNRIGCLSEEQLAREREKLGEKDGRPGSSNR